MLIVAPQGTVTSLLAAKAGRQIRQQKDMRGRTAIQWSNGTDGELAGETGEESPERGIQPKGRHTGTSLLAISTQRSSSKLQPTRAFGSFHIPTQVVPTLFWLAHAPPRFSLFGFPDTKKTCGEQKGVAACEKVTSMYGYDGRLWSDVLLL